MTRPRSILAGMTDYTGVGLEDIAAHLRDWHDSTARAIEFLERQIPVSEERAKLLVNPAEVTRYVAYFIDLFKRYLADLERLVKEIPTGVQEKHVEVVSQLFNSSQAEEHYCVRFKNDFVYKPLPNEEMRPFLDDIYVETRDQLIDYKDLSNLVSRLRTFVDQAPSGDEQALKLTPGIWGIGLDLRVLGRRVKRWLTRRLV